MTHDDPIVLVPGILQEVWLLEMASAGYLWNTRPLVEAGLTVQCIETSIPCDKAIGSFHQVGWSITAPFPVDVVMRMEQPFAPDTAAADVRFRTSA